MVKVKIVIDESIEAGVARITDEVLQGKRDKEKAAREIKADNGKQGVMMPAEPESMSEPEPEPEPEAPVKFSTIISKQGKVSEISVDVPEALDTESAEELRSKITEYLHKQGMIFDVELYEE